MNFFNLLQLHKSNILSLTWLILSDGTAIKHYQNEEKQWTTGIRSRNHYFVDMYASSAPPSLEVIKSKGLSTHTLIWKLLEWVKVSQMFRRVTLNFRTIFRSLFLLLDTLTNCTSKPGNIIHSISIIILSTIFWLFTFKIYKTQKFRMFYSFWFRPSVVFLSGQPNIFFNFYHTCCCLSFGLTSIPLFPL